MRRSAEPNRPKPALRTTAWAAGLALLGCALPMAAAAPAAKAPAEATKPAAGGLFADFDDQQPYPSKEALKQFLLPVPGNRYDLADAVKNNRPFCRFGGLMRLNLPWPEDTALRFSFIDARDIRWSIWNGNRGVTLAVLQRVLQRLGSLRRGAAGQPADVQGVGPLGDRWRPLSPLRRGHAGDPLSAGPAGPDARRPAAVERSFRGAAARGVPGRRRAGTRFGDGSVEGDSAAHRPDSGRGQSHFRRTKIGTVPHRCAADGQTCRAGMDRSAERCDVPAAAGRGCRVAGRRKIARRTGGHEARPAGILRSARGSRGRRPGDRHLPRRARRQAGLPAGRLPSSRDRAKDLRHAAGLRCGLRPRGRRSQGGSVSWSAPLAAADRRRWGGPLLDQ